MSALKIVIDSLVAEAVAIGVASTRIYPITADEKAGKPYIVVNLVSEPDEQLLLGAGQYPESRVSIECLSNSAAECYAIGEAVKVAIQDITKATIGAYRDVDIRKADSDVTGYSDERKACKREMDYYVRWRT